MELIIHSTCWRCGTINPLLGNAEWCYKCTRTPDKENELRIEKEKKKANKNWRGKPLDEGRYVYYMGRWRG